MPLMPSAVEATDVSEGDDENEGRAAVKLERERVEPDEREPERAGTRSGNGGGHNGGDRRLSSSSSLESAEEEKGPGARFVDDGGAGRPVRVRVGTAGRDREGAVSDSPVAAPAEEADLDRPCFPLLADRPLDIGRALVWRDRLFSRIDGGAEDDEDGAVAGLGRSSAFRRR